MTAQLAGTIPAWSATSSGSPGATVPSRPAGNDLHLVYAILARDTESWTPTFSIGTVSPTQTLTAIDQGACHLRCYIFDEADVDTMPNFTIGYSDGSEYINPMASIAFWVKDSEQATIVFDTDAVSGTALSLSTTGNTVNDLIVAIMALADDAPDIDSWDTLTEVQQQNSGTQLTAGLAAGNTTDTTHDFTHDGSALNIGAYVLHFVGSSSVVDPTILTVGPIAPAVIYDNEQIVELVCNDAEAAQGAGYVKLHDTDPLTTTPSVSVTQSIISWANGLVKFTCDGGALSPGTVWIELANDQGGATSLSIELKADPGSSAVGVRVNPVPDRSIALGEAFTFQSANYAFASDAQDRLTYGISGQPPSLVQDSDTGVLTGIIDSDADSGSPYTVTVTATDLLGNEASDEFTWTVTSLPAAGSIVGSNRRKRGFFLTSNFRR